MASLIFAHAKAIYNKKEKHDRDLRKIFGDDHDLSTARTQFIERERAKFRDILQIAQLLHEDYKQVTGAETHNWFFITIRPRPGVEFDTFYTLVHKYINRAFMESYKLAFEQKDPNGSGEGFHVHIVCFTKHASKGQCLRDTISSFRKVCEDNCIDVQTTRNPEDIVNNYLLEYKSDDNHKAPTKEGDKIWRTNMLLNNLYSNMDNCNFCPLPAIRGGCLSSPKTAPNIPQGPIIVELA